MTAWVPHESQPKSLERGTANVSMADLSKHLDVEIAHIDEEEEGRNETAGTDEPGQR